MALDAVNDLITPGAIINFSCSLLLLFVAYEVSVRVGFLLRFLEQQLDSIQVCHDYDFEVCKHRGLELLNNFSYCL